MEMSPSAENIEVYTRFLKELDKTYSVSPGKRTVTLNSGKMSRRTGLAGFGIRMFTEWLHENGLAVREEESTGRVHYTFNLPVIRGYLNEHDGNIRGAEATDRSGRH